ANSPDLIAKLEKLGDEFLAQTQSLADEQSIRAAQAQFLGKKGKVSEVMKELGKLPAGERPQVGGAGNKVKEKFEQVVEEVTTPRRTMSRRRARRSSRSASRGTRARRSKPISPARSMSRCLRARSAAAICTCSRRYAWRR